MFWEKVHSQKKFLTQVNLRSFSKVLESRHPIFQGTFRKRSKILPAKIEGNFL